jgi:polysaccharide deacetylase family protein (PEP-CTERM system associated)
MSGPSRPMANIFSVDVEDWFHILGLPSSNANVVESWSGLESRVEKNFRVLMDLFSEAGLHATCFILGWVAERFPGVVREAADRGHEIASHGYGHQLISTQTRAEFAADVRRSKDLLEQASGKRVFGYRAPSFSITAETRWALDELVAAGYTYDSSIFPTKRDFGGILGSDKAPHRLKTSEGTIVEFPISVANLFGKDVCFFGGGYLRLFPHFLIKRMSDRVNDEGRPVIYYIHPREIDPSHPRLRMPPFKRFKTYVNLRTTAPKLRAIMRERTLTTFEGWLADNASTLGQPQ